MEDINDALVGMDEMDSPPLSLGTTTTTTTTTPSDHGESIEDDDGDGYDIDGDDSLENAKKAKRDGEALNFIKWRKVTKHLYSQERARVTCCVLHKPSKTLITGFNNGVFTLHEMPDFNKIHALNMSDRAITSVAVNRTGEWLAFGCQSMGQLLVWEWQSETYILKQQSHFNDMNCMCYSPDGHVIATGGDDGKVKLWDTSSGFCFATFNEHSAAVTAVCITSNGKVVVSASLDGTVRAFDLQRYRNFRTMVSPRPVQFTSLAVDVSGEVISAGSHDTFEIFIWSLKTGRLLEILSGHEGPVSSLSFSPTLSVLASSSWDKTVKLWDVFENKGNVETFTFLSDVQALTYSPDGTQLAVSTLDGVISLWDVSSSSQVGSIEGKNDLEVGRSSADRITAKRLSENAFFTCLCYTVDGQNLLAGGKSKYVCLYDTNHQQLLKKFQTSHNKSLDGLSQFLNSRKMTEAGPLEMISDEERDSDEEKSLIPLPGVMKGDYSSRKEHPVIRTKSLQFSPTGKAWAAVTTEGLMVFTIEAGILFNPYDLTVDLTPDIVRQAIHDREYTHALVMSIRLNEPSLILESIEQVPPTDVELVLRGLPQVYIERLLPFLSDQVYSSPHIGYYMAWCTKLLSLYTQTIKSNSRALLSSITDLQKSISQRQSDLGQMYVFSYY
jgi:periodic tryptophan protein 2